MAWKATGQPTVRKQRDKWVVRVDGIDTATGKHRPRQLGTYTSQRAALMAARSGRADSRSTRARHGQLAGAPLRRRPDRHHAQGAGELRVGDPAHRGRARGDPDRPARPRGCRRVDRRPRRRRAALPAQRPDLPHRAAGRARRGGRGGTDPAQPGGACRPSRGPSPSRSKQKEVEAWNAAEIDRFLEASRGPSLGDRVPARRALRTAPQRGARAATGTISTPRRRRCGSTRASSPSAHGAAWSDAKNERSRRRIPLDDETIRTFSRRRAEQATERLARRRGMGGQRLDHRDPAGAARPASLATTGRSPCSSRRRACRD